MFRLGREPLRLKEASSRKSFCQRTFQSIAAAAVDSRANPPVRNDHNPAGQSPRMDSKATIGELRDLVAKFVRERDWEKYHRPKDLAMALSIEAAELLELFLWEQDKGGAMEERLAEKGKEELADVMIYCLSLANAQGWDLSEAVKAKVRKNEKKYPADKYRGVARLG
jgi:dCTP diphosphatase